MLFVFETSVLRESLEYISTYLEKLTLVCISHLFFSEKSVSWDAFGRSLVNLQCLSDAYRRYTSQSPVKFMAY